MLKDYINYAVKNIIKRKMRSWLTMIGIFIGVAAVVALTSIGQGLQNAIMEEFQSLGADKLIIQAKGAGFGGMGTNPNKISEEDLKKIVGINSVDVATGAMYDITTIEFDDKQVLYFVYAVPEDNDEKKLLQETFTYSIILGRDLKKGEKGKIVMGYNYAFKEVFDRNLRPGDKVLVKDKEYEVVGFVNQIGSEYDDTVVYMDKEEFKQAFEQGEEYDMVIARVRPDADPASVVGQVEKALRRSRDLDEGNEDFEVQTFDEYLQTFLTIFGVVQSVIIGIAAISLLVGAIGIMNTMYTAVLERTKEIGVMKAIGARNSDILTIFLIESGLLGFVGGAIGIVLGMGLSKIIEIAGQAAMGSDLLRSFFPPWLIIGALLFATLLGMFAGFLPARQASSLQPVEALRYE